jgi:hypothetical protein
MDRATPKDEYPIPIADMLINDASGHRVISFNFLMIMQVTIRFCGQRGHVCPRFVGLFEWVVMTFGFKNGGATY